MLMTVKVRPNGRVGVEVFLAVNITQNGAGAGRDDDRFTLEPIVHLCEGMPDELMIKFREFVHRLLAGSNCLRGGVACFVKHSRQRGDIIG